MEKVKISDDFQVEVDETLEDEVAVKFDIATYPSDFTLAGIVDMWHKNDITIPEFQREFVWSIKQSSLLIESFLLGLPVPPVFFYIDDENKNLVIDGQQRILSVVFYFDGYFGFENLQGKRQVFRLQGLDEGSPYSKKKFSELADADQRKLRNSVLRAINIRQLAPKGESTSVYHIFERLNTGGTPLKAQEIRNVVFRGELVSKLRELNTNKYWRRILGKSTFDKHQRDVELVLRLFALSNKIASYEKPMKEFLNKAMDNNKSAKSADIPRFNKLFPKVVELIVNRLGEKPFHLRGPLNTSVLDSVVCVLLDNYDQIPDDLSNRYMKLCKNDEFSELTTAATTNTNTVKERYKVAKKHLIDN